MCKRDRLEESYPKTTYYCPRINKTIEFNSQLNVKGIMYVPPCDWGFGFLLFDSLDKIVGEVFVDNRHPYIRKVGFKNYDTYKLGYQKLFQDSIYRLSKTDSSHIYSFTSLKTNKGDILLNKIYSKPNHKNSKDKINTDSIIKFQRPEWANASFLLDSFKIDISPPFLENSYAYSDSVLIPIINTFKVRERNPLTDSVKMKRYVKSENSFTGLKELYLVEYQDMPKPGS